MFGGAASQRLHGVDDPPAEDDTGHIPFGGAGDHLTHAAFQRLSDANRDIDLHLDPDADLHTYIYTHPNHRRTAGAGAGGICFVRSSPQRLQ